MCYRWSKPTPAGLNTLLIFVEVGTIKPSLSLPSWKNDQGSFHTILSESFHFKTHAFAASSRFQITFSFFNLSLSIFWSLLLHQISPCSTNLLPLMLSGMVPGDSDAGSLVLPISGNFTGQAPQDPQWEMHSGKCCVASSLLGVLQYSLVHTKGLETPHYKEACLVSINKH